MRLVTRAQWGAAPGRGVDQFRDFAGCMIHWRGGGVPQSNHANCAGEIRAGQRTWMNQGHKDMAYNALVCVHGFVFEGRPMRTAGSANGVGRLPNANFRYASVCAQVGPGNPQGELLHNAIRDAVRWVNGWGSGFAVRQIVPHSANIATQCCGDELRALIARGFFNPGTQPPQPPSGGGVLANFTEAQLRQIFRQELDRDTTTPGFAIRFRRATNRIAALMPSGNPDGAGVQGPNRGELLRAISNDIRNGTIPRLNAQGQPAMDQPAILGNTLAFLDARVANIERILLAGAAGRSGGVQAVADHGPDTPEEPEPGPAAEEPEESS